MKKSPARRSLPDVRRDRLAARSTVCALLAAVPIALLTACGADDGAPVTANAPPAVAHQPSSIRVVAGTTASFTVAASCTRGAISIQWQRASGQPFADIVGATAATYSLVATTSDDGASFRAVLDCGGTATTTTATASLTVAPPLAVTLSLLPTVGLRDQAPIGGVNGIVASPLGGWDFTSFNAIRHLSADLSTVTLVAGGMDFGNVDGPADRARFFGPQGVTTDAAGTIYVADTVNSTIRVVAGGMVSTLAGPATGLAHPSAIAFGPDGDLYVAQPGAIRRVTTAGIATVYAGTGDTGFADGTPATARFSDIGGVVVAPNGDVYVADRFNSRIRRIVRGGGTASAVVTIAGNGSIAIPGVDGVGLAAGIPFPSGLALVGRTLYTLDGAGTVRAIDVDSGVVATVAGSPLLGPGYADGPPGAARFGGLAAAGLAPGPSGGLVVADIERLRTVNADGGVTTIASAVAAGTDPATGVLSELPFTFDSGGPLSLTSVATDATNRVVVSENTTKLVRRIDADGNVSLVAGLAFSLSTADGRGSAAAFVDNGSAVAVAADGTLFTSDNYGVRRIAPDGTTTLLAGSRTISGAADGDATTARFYDIAGLAVGPSGDLFVADLGNSAVRRVDSAGNTSTYAGALDVFGSIDGPRSTARFHSPRQLAFAPDGNLYVVDVAGPPAVSTLRRIAPDGNVSTVPGTVGALRIAVDPAGTLYVALQVGSAQTLGVLDPVSGAFSPLVSTGDSVVLGDAAPRLGPQIGSIAAHGVKQVLVVSAGRLILVSLP